MAPPSRVNMAGRGLLSLASHAKSQLSHTKPLLCESKGNAPTSAPTSCRKRGEGADRTPQAEQAGHATDAQPDALYAANVVPSSHCPAERGAFAGLLVRIYEYDARRRSASVRPITTVLHCNCAGEIYVAPPSNYGISAPPGQGHRVFGCPSSCRLVPQPWPRKLSLAWRAAGKKDDTAQPVDRAWSVVGNERRPPIPRLILPFTSKKGGCGCDRHPLDAPTSCE